jgi:hypothetical protein
MATNEDEAAPQPTSVPTRTGDASHASAQAANGFLPLKAMGSAARRLFGNWRALIVLLVLYFALVASLYLFIAVREARLWQVLATFLLAALALVLFFIIQAMGTRYVENSSQTKELLRWSVRNFWKLLVVTLPVVLLAWLIAYLFGKFHVDAAAAVSEAGRAGAGAAAARTTAPRAATEVFSWKEVIISTLRFLILWLILPLLAIHLWIAAARRGPGGAFRTIKRVLAQALAPGAVMIYALGLLIFGVIPYFLITTNFSRGGAWTEITLLGARLLLAALFIIFGWLVTLGALSILSPEVREEQVKVEQADGIASDAGVE